MSDLQLTIDNLQKENMKLKQQLTQNNQGVESVMAQLEAHKGMLNEQLNQGLALRAQVVTLNKQLQKANADIQNSQKTIESLNQQLTDATANIAKLSTAPENKPAEVQVPAA